MLRSERKSYDNIITFDGDIHQVRLKNRRFIGEFFSFQTRRVQDQSRSPGSKNET